MNSYFRFPENAPPSTALLYWDREAEKWCIWFGSSGPQIADENFTPFREPLFEYKLVEIPYQKQELYEPMEKKSGCQKYALKDKTYEDE